MTAYLKKVVFSVSYQFRKSLKKHLFVFFEYIKMEVLGFSGKIIIFEDKTVSVNW